MLSRSDQPIHIFFTSVILRQDRNSQLPRHRIGVDVVVGVQEVIFTPFQIKLGRNVFGQFMLNHITASAVK